MNVVGYLRVSTSEQGVSGLGLKAQRRAIEDTCKQRGWTLIGMYEDTASGAKADGREGLTEALRILDSGEASALIVSRLDRLSRSLLDFAKLMQRSQRRKWSLVALDLGVDTTTPAGEMMANVIVTVAQYEARIIGERTKSALLQARAGGTRLGRPRTIPAKVRGRITRMSRAGKSLRAIAQALNEERVPTAQGGARWYPATIAKVLASPPESR